MMTQLVISSEVMMAKAVTVKPVLPDCKTNFPFNNEVEVKLEVDQC